MLSDIPQHLFVFISLGKLESENKNFTIFPITPITFQEAENGGCTALANGQVPQQLFNTTKFKAI